MQKRNNVMHGYYMVLMYSRITKITLIVKYCQTL